jgi:hypothetical protein
MITGWGQIKPSNGATPDHRTHYGQSPALLVIKAHSPATELFSKNPILLSKIFNDLQLPVVHPPGDGDQQNRKGSSTLSVFKTHYRDRRAAVAKLAKYRIFMQIQFSGHTRAGFIGNTRFAGRVYCPGCAGLHVAHSADRRPAQNWVCSSRRRIRRPSSAGRLYIAPGESSSAVVPRRAPAFRKSPRVGAVISPEA